MSSATQVTINGAHGEGGSATFRTALVMSCLTQQSVRIFNVRGATRKPGLTPEDLSLLNLLQLVTKAKVSGDELGANDVLFEPTQGPRPVHTAVDIHRIQAGKVPGNVNVIAQSALPVLARAGGLSTIELTGETHTPNSLSFDSFELSTLYSHQMQGLYAYPALQKSGFGYGGKGKILLEVEPSAFNPIVWDRRQELVNFGVRITHTEIPTPIVRELLAKSTTLLAGLGEDPEIEEAECSGSEPGLSVTFFAQYKTGSGSGSSNLIKGTNGSGTITNAWNSFQSWLKIDATVDSFLADQLLVTAALTEGRSVFTTPAVTRRLVSIGSVIKQFLPIHVTVKGREGSPGTVIVER